MQSILSLILTVLTLYSYVIIGVAVLSWLIAFNVVNINNDMVRSIWNALNALTEPVLRPIRKVLPSLGGLDIAPVILLLGIWFVQNLIHEYGSALIRGV